MKHLGFLLLILSTYTHAKILTSLKAQLYQNGYPLKKCEVNIIAPSWAVLSTHCRLGESRDSFNQNFYITDRNHRIYYIQDHYFHSDFFSEEVRTFQDTAYLQDLFLQRSYWSDSANLSKVILNDIQDFGDIMLIQIQSQFYNVSEFPELDSEIANNKSRYFALFEMNNFNLMSVVQMFFSKTVGKKIVEFKSQSRSENPCNGNSGSGLYKVTNSKVYLSGILSSSHAVSGCNPGSPQRYTKISPYINWINSIIEENSTSN